MLYCHNTFPILQKLYYDTKKIHYGDILRFSIGAKAYSDKNSLFKSQGKKKKTMETW